MGLDVGGYEDRTDWPKLGPLLLISTCLILAIRTAKWPARFDSGVSERDLEAEIGYAAHLAGAVLSALTSKKPQFFPTKGRAWYQANDDDTPK